MRSPSWRPMPLTNGYWMMVPGYRQRIGLRTIVRPILICGYEEACEADSGAVAGGDRCAGARDGDIRVSQMSDDELDRVHLGGANYVGNKRPAPHSDERAW
jgi:hypothetical protein